MLATDPDLLSNLANQRYTWDLLYPELAKLFHEPWGKPIPGADRRQSVATLFAMRALRRMQAVNALFVEGLYLESHALIRGGYEDWVQMAFLLHQPGDERCNEFRLSTHKHDARVYDAFAGLCGQEATGRCFGEPPAAVADFVGRARSQTNPVLFTTMADDVGLRIVHNFVYTYLSGRSHPNGRYREIFDDSEPMAIIRIPRRDSEAEFRLGLWFGWFTVRIATLACREFGIDHEPFCEDFFFTLRETSGVNLETCVFVREFGSARPGTTAASDTRSPS
jgi:hypothetical protein